MSEMKIVGISGSLRKQSRNSGLLRKVAELVPENVSFTVADLKDVPLYNSDIPTDQKPESVLEIFDQLAQADALVLACPEYNYSIAPALKNIIDWASREPDNVLLAGKPVAIVGAGGGMGTSRAQYHLRQVCVFVDLYPLNKPEFFSNSFSDSYNDDGDLIDPDKIEELGKIVSTLIKKAEATSFKQ